jgi:hypothetical protein
MASGDPLYIIPAASDSHSANTPFRFRVFAPAGSEPERLELLRV